MKLLGFYLGLHDSSVSALADGVVRYRKFERLSGEKHQRAKLKDVFETCESWGVRPEYAAFSDGNRNGLGNCGIDQLFHEVSHTLIPSARKVFCLDHHFAHSLSAWPHGPVRTDTVAVAIDGRGDNGLRCRAVRLGSGLETVQLKCSSEFIIGRFFSRIGARMGLAGDPIDFPGKVMGAQAYGEVDECFVDRFSADEPETLPRRLLESIRWRGDLPTEQAGFFSFENTSFLDWLATCHKILSDALLRFFAGVGADGGPVLYTGGCAQNSVFNEALSLRFPGLVIPPSAYDGGLSLGCLEFLRRLLDLPPFAMPEFPFAQDDEDVGYASTETVGRVAELLEDGKIVGWMQGRGEIGPRALGHRSILVDPRRSDAKDVLNLRVKRREPWRPYAASVMEDKASRWFQLASPSPYMLRAVPVLPEAATRVPAVVHRDGTCRVQTVDGAVPVLESFHELLEEFERVTGVPLVLNTSLNSGGEPIHGSVPQAQRLLSEGRLDALCVGDRLLLGNQ